MYTVSSNDVYAFRSAPKRMPLALQEVHQVVLGKAPRPVERHVLHEVRHAALRVGLQDGAGIHHEPQLGALFRLRVSANEVVQPVGQHAAHDFGVCGQRRRRIALRVGRGCDEKERGNERHSGA